MNVCSTSPSLNPPRPRYGLLRLAGSPTRKSGMRLGGPVVQHHYADARRVVVVVGISA